jgi:hypothetical protein
VTSTAAVSIHFRVYDPISWFQAGDERKQLPLQSTSILVAKATLHWRSQVSQDVMAGG